MCDALFIHGIRPKVNVAYHTPKPTCEVGRNSTEYDIFLPRSRAKFLVFRLAELGKHLIDVFPSPSKPRPPLRRRVACRPCFGFPAAGDLLDADLLRSHASGPPSRVPSPDGVHGLLDGHHDFLGGGGYGGLVGDRVYHTPDRRRGSGTGKMQGTLTVCIVAHPSPCTGLEVHFFVERAISFDVNLRLVELTALPRAYDRSFARSTAYCTVFFLRFSHHAVGVKCGGDPNLGREG